MGSWLRMGSCRTGHAGLCSGTHISACHFVQGDWPAHASLLLWVGYAQRHFMLPKQALVPGFPLAPPTFQHPMSRGHQEPSLLWGIALCNLLHFFPVSVDTLPWAPPVSDPKPLLFPEAYLRHLQLCLEGCPSSHPPNRVHRVPSRCVGSAEEHKGSQDARGALSQEACSIKYLGSLERRGGSSRCRGVGVSGGLRRLPREVTSGEGTSCPSRWWLRAAGPD